MRNLLLYVIEKIGQISFEQFNPILLLQFCWCVTSHYYVLQEWLQVDLLKETIITGVITQGRYAGGQGEEFAELISVEVWQEEEQTWLKVVEEAPANRDTYSKVELMLDRRVVTDKVRVIPVSEHHRMVCLRIELLGCSPDGELLLILLTNYKLSNGLLLISQSNV